MARFGKENPLSKMVIFLKMDLGDVVLWRSAVVATLQNYVP